MSLMPTPWEALLEGVLEGKPLTRPEAVRLYQEADLWSLGKAADLMRRRQCDPSIVTFLIDRCVNYTNVCGTRCKFCAFATHVGSSDAYILEPEAAVAKVHEAVAKGATQILLQGGHHPALEMGYYLRLLSAIKKAHPGVTLHAFSPPELVHLSRLFHRKVQDLLVAFREAGMDSMPGGGAEILSDRVRALTSPAKATTQEWLGVMRILHGLGMRSTATMMFGHLETIPERVEHLFLIRELQMETKGFLGFIPWLYQPGNEALGLSAAGGQTYLRTLALSRLVLGDVLPNLQASWVTPGKKVGQLGLVFGANDFGSVMLEENVVAATGLHYDMELDEMRRLIRGAGFQPRQRATDYRPVS
jgi:cyclic dehypoxanthinyl futalosine synthase